ncbi:hypothetical protein ACWOOC_23975 [Citrobacter sp. ESY80]|uniref:hypothetical protein n=1 Tax=Citrobacter TaxID=544 RepID=UPI0010CA1C38|nr:MULTISPECIES: hypothetical protein [unclassified Citrobacter]EBQ9589856.1 hypothetical protein [Salmonella enterica subsp. enterica serovar Penarth]EBR9221828.1 hypothetical protein [Salmonella enterica subsp. enterica serovar Wangata]MBJ9325199.1 hypothetical protein [Citrobacter freundii]HBC6265891.1 hypothetical protein [Citrobacter braakii]ECA5265518.1 hypothetical protein [Salmonella enterica subsp. enterica serovar Wangata]
MRYWILVALLNGLFALVIHFAAPEIYGTMPYFVGVGICSLIAMLITWNDPSALLDEILFFGLKWLALAGGVAFSIWGIGCKLELWGNSEPDAVFSNAFDTIMPNLAILTGLMMLFGAYVWYQRR